MQTKTSLCSVNFGGGDEKMCGVNMSSAPLKTLTFPHFRSTSHQHSLLFAHNARSDSPDLYRKLEEQSHCPGRNVTLIAGVYMYVYLGQSTLKPQSHQDQVVYSKVVGLCYLFTYHAANFTMSTSKLLLGYHLTNMLLTAYCD